MRKDEHINQHVGLAMKRDKLDKLLNYYRNEKMLCTMSFYKETCLYGRNHAGLTRHINHSCSPNCYGQKWEAQVYSGARIFAKCNIQLGD